MKTAICSSQSSINEDKIKLKRWKLFNKLQEFNLPKRTPFYKLNCFKDLKLNIQNNLND